jgi:ankyrin repeat protein
MAIGSSHSLLNQPATVFTIACASITLVALSALWRSRAGAKGTHSLQESAPAFTKPGINIADEGYSSATESPQQQKSSSSSKQERNSPSFASISSLIANCSKLLQSVNSFNVAEENEAIVMSSLSAELPMSIAALCQIQQLLGLYYDVLGKQPGLKSCFETVLTGLATVVSTLDGELATLSDCDYSVRKFPSTGANHRHFEELIQNLQSHRQSLLFCIDSIQKASQPSTSTPYSLGPPAASNSKAHTPGTDLSHFMLNSPDFDEPPEYSPPADGHAMAPESKCPPSHAVEIDSNPIPVKANSNTAVTVADIFAAVLENDASELESLLSLGFDPNTTYGKLQRTPLHEAARLNRPTCAKVLLNFSAIADIDDAKGDAPLHLASWEGHVEVASVLLSSGVDMDRLSGRDGYSPLWCAITGRHIDFVRLLCHSGARISLKNPADALPLHQVAITGQSAMCELLLERGASVDCVDAEQNTPLHYAATTGDLRTAKALVKEGANVNAQQERGLSPLHWACHKGHKEMVQWLLEHGAEINSRSETFATPLHCSAAKGHLSCAKILVRKGADCKIPTSRWDGVAGTAEEVAIGKGYMNVAAFIRDSMKK